MTIFVWIHIPELYIYKLVKRCHAAVFRINQLRVPTELRAKKPNRFL